jgi:peptidoglycan L-alanyl-D-glutamate endopeptidase CwlK
LSGTRTYAEQNKLYKIRPKVTNAGPGQSNHNFGIALDVGLFKGAKYLTGATRAEEKAYADFAAAVKAEVHDIEAGIDWVSFPDAPHYQLKTGRTLREVRQLFEQGANFIT